MADLLPEMIGKPQVPKMDAAEEDWEDHFALRWERRMQGLCWCFDKDVGKFDCRWIPRCFQLSMWLDTGFWVFTGTYKLYKPKDPRDCYGRYFPKS